MKNTKSRHLVLLAAATLCGLGIAFKFTPAFQGDEDQANAPALSDQQLPTGPLASVCRAYVDAGEALARDDHAVAVQSLQRLITAAERVESEAPRDSWTTASKTILSAARKAVDTKDRSSFRNHFRDLSESMVPLGPELEQTLRVPLYEVFCPMAFDDQGASWLQTSKKVANPYYGAEMLRCGTILPVAKAAAKRKEAPTKTDEALLAADAQEAPKPGNDLFAEHMSHHHHHGPSAGGTAEPHSDHNPHHRGVLMMNGDLHFETVVEESGKVSVYFSDAYRRPLSPTVVEDMELILRPDETDEESLRVVMDEAETHWTGQGGAVDKAGVNVLVAFTFKDEPFAAEIEVAHPLTDAEKKKESNELAERRSKGSDIPGAINLGMTGKQQAGSYAGGYLEDVLGKKIAGTYQQSGKAHFKNEPHVDVPLMVAAAGETVSLGARAPKDAPVRTYNVSAINADITLNQYHDFFPGYMFVLTENVKKVRAEELRNEDARFEENDPGAVTNGLSGDAIQPLSIRVNQGERLVIVLKNEVEDEKVSLHLHGSGLVIQATGRPATSTNSDAYVESGKTQIFEWYVPPDQQEGVHHMHSHFRDQASQGLFGSVVVEPEGSRFLDPYTGNELKSGWLAMIEDPDGPDFREFVVVYHEVGDEEFRPLDKNEDMIPLRDQVADDYRPSTRAINYRSESFANNLLLQKKKGGVMDESMGYSSYTFGDPSTPIPRSYLGDPAKWRLVHGGSEVFHSHHLHGGAIRWRRQSKLTQDLNLFGVNNFALASGGPVKFPPVRSTSDRVDVQTIGPSETHDLTIECCSGGCQFTAGDFLYHCHIPHHYVAGMWAFWRTYNTLQTPEISTDVMPQLAELPDRSGKMQAGVDSTKLVGKTMKWFGKDFQVVATAEEAKGKEDTFSIDEWVEMQLPPQGQPGKKADETAQMKAYDASVWDWAKKKNPAGMLVYLGEPETTVKWPKYRPAKPGERPVILFDQETGKLAWPHMKPHFGKRPPFSPDHNPAPFLEPIRRNADGTKSSKVARSGENGPWSLSPQQTAESQVKKFNVHAIKLPITLSKAEGNGEGHLAPIVDEDGQIYVLHEEEENIRADDDLKIPLVLRMNVHDTADVILTNEIPDFDENLYASKVNMHIHFVQFDTQASDGVITGMSYEQSVRPFTMLDGGNGKGFGKPQNEPLTADAAVGDTKVALRSADPFHVGTLIGIGMDQVGKMEIRRITAVEGASLVLDEPLEYAHKKGEIASVEFVRYRWFADADFGITYWHDHAYGLTSWGHGLFGCTVIEPKGSTYHDPKSGEPVRSGSVVDIRTNQPVSARVRGSFREYVMQIQDSNPRTENRIVSGTVFEKPAEGQTVPQKISKIGSMDSWSLMDTPFRYLNGGERTSGSSFGLRVEPLNRRLAVNPDPSVVFSSSVHGDPDTPILSAYLGDPIVIRALDHAGNEMHTVHLNGHYFPLERYAADSRPKSSVHLGIAERYDLVIPAAGGPQQQSGDYMYHSGRVSHFGEGMWGIVRVLDEATEDLQPLPGREEIPKSAAKFYPDDAPVKTFNVSAIDLPMDLNPLAPATIKTKATNREIIADNPQGKCYVLDEEIAAAQAGTKEMHPLVLRANVGDVIKIKLTNRLKKGRASFHADMLAYDPKDSLGINLGNNKGDQTIAPGETKTYTFYAHPEYGEAAALVTDWGNVMLHPRDGLYGAIIVGPKGSQYYDPATGKDVTLKNSWRADVVVDRTIPANKDRINYRDAALFFQDEDNVIGTAFMPYAKESAGLTAVNYRIEPLAWRSEKYGLDFENAYVTDGKNDPVTPIIEAHVGDAVRIHVFGAHSEQNTIFSLEGHQWALEPDMEGGELLESEQLGATDALEVNVIAGGRNGIPGDYVYMNHRLAYAEAGQWGVFRVLASAVPQLASTEPQDADQGKGGEVKDGQYKVDFVPQDVGQGATETVDQTDLDDTAQPDEEVSNEVIDLEQDDAAFLQGTVKGPGKSMGNGTGSSPWSTLTIVFAVCGFGALLLWSGRRGAKLACLFLALSSLTYFANVAMAADDAPKGGNIRSLDSYNPANPSVVQIPGSADKRIRTLSSYNRVQRGPKVWARYLIPQDSRGKLAPLPVISPPNPIAAELGKMLFFDNRVSGDADISCAKCHQPEKGWADGEALSTGYPGTRYFRNTPTILNAVYADYLYWDGRLGGDDPATQVRDSINDSHFLSSDGRVMLERMKQIPEYVELFAKAGLGEPTHTGITKAIAAFERTLVSQNVPFDNYLKGNENAISAQARQGLELFKGKAGCTQCHNGPYLSDQKPHNLGVPENPEVFSDPFRIITFRSHLKFVGTPNYMNLRNDPGHFAVSKLYKDFGKFITPSLREVSRTAPYMHNGMIPSLKAVVAFYNSGGGANNKRKDPLLKPLNLNAGEQSALVEFLKTLSSGDKNIMQLTQKELPSYKIIKDWYAKQN